MNILIVSQYFFPEHFRINAVAQALVDRGHCVSVLTGKPNYPEGKFKKGYKPLSFTRCVESGITVFRVPIIARGENNKFLLLANYLSFVISGIFFSRQRLRNEKFDVIYCYGTSPIFQAFPAIFLGKKMNIPVVLNVQDLWPQSLEVTGNVRNKFILKIIETVVSFIYRQCDLILCSSKPFVNEVLRLSPSSSVRYLPNSSDVIFGIEPNINELYREEIDKIQAALSGSFNCVYAGNLGKAQALETIITAAKELVGEKGIRFVVFGGGNKHDWMQRQIEKFELNNVHLMGRFPSVTMRYLFSKADCLILSLADTPIFRMTLPNKVQTYLSSGKPIVGAITGEGARVISEAKAGFCCNPNDSGELSKLVLKMRDVLPEVRREFGCNGIRYFDKNFNDEVIIAELEGYLFGLVELR